MFFLNRLNGWSSNAVKLNPVGSKNDIICLRTPSSSMLLFIEICLCLIILGPSSVGDHSIQ